MPTGHRVQKWGRPAATFVLPKEVTQTAPRAYVDRFGMEYQVIWNGQAGDPPIDQLGRAST